MPAAMTGAPQPPSREKASWKHTRPIMCAHMTAVQGTGQKGGTSEALRCKRGPWRALQHTPQAAARAHIPAHKQHHTPCVKLKAEARAACSN